MVESNKSAEALYQALMSHYIHQDRMVYMSVPYLAIIQTATIGGGWSVAHTHHGISAALAGLGVLLSVFYLLYVIAAKKDSLINEPIMEKLANELVERTSAKGSQPRTSAWPEGRLWKLSIFRLVLGVIASFILIDLVMVVVFAHGWLS